MAEPPNIPFPLLLTDCSSPGVRVGIMDSSGWMSYSRSTGETGAVLFQAVKEVLLEARLTLSEIKSFTYCEGPGSTLGIRINSMALRTWVSLSETPMPIFAYKSLEAATVIVRDLYAPHGEYAILSDLRKNSWNGLQVHSDNTYSDIELVDVEQLAAWPEPRYFIQQRIHSPGLPPKANPLDYDLQSVGTGNAFMQLLREVDTPEVFQTAVTEFKKWTPARHR